MQSPDDDLMPRARRRRHEQFPVHHLVAVAVVRQRAHHLDRVVDRGDHAHSIGSSAEMRQGGGTLESAMPSPPVTTERTLPTSENDKRPGSLPSAVRFSPPMW